MSTYNNISNPEHLAAINTLITKVLNNMSVDFLNKMSTDNNFDVVVESIQLAELSITEDDGEVCICVNVEFTDSDNNTDANAFIFVGVDNVVYIDFPY